MARHVRGTGTKKNSSHHNASCVSPPASRRKKKKKKKKEVQNAFWQLFQRRISTFSSVYVHTPQPGERQRRGRSGRAELADGGVARCHGKKPRAATLRGLRRRRHHGWRHHPSATKSWGRRRRWRKTSRPETAIKDLRVGSSSSRHLPLFTCSRTLRKHV